MTEAVAERDLAASWPSLDREVSAAVDEARARFERAVTEGGDVTGSWTAFRAASRARVLLAEQARAAAGTDELLRSRIISVGYGPQDFAAAVAEVAERAAAERAEEELERLLAG